MEVIFDDLLRFIFPEAEKIIDMDHGFDFLDKELGEIYPEPDKTSETRYVDKLVKYSVDGREEWVLVHLEVQGYRTSFSLKGCSGIITGYRQVSNTNNCVSYFHRMEWEDMPAC